MADFKGSRYMTKGVQTEIDSALQIIMWDMIDEDIAKCLKMDYLQVFELKPINVNGSVFQEIVHRQEIPKRERKITVGIILAPIKEKIFVIDSDEYITMLLASEY